jgi:hypothetical protein
MPAEDSVWLNTQQRLTPREQSACCNDHEDTIFPGEMRTLDVQLQYDQLMAQQA